MKNTRRAVMLTMLLLIISGCSTIQGIGQDIRKLGNAIENSGR